LCLYSNQSEYMKIGKRSKFARHHQIWDFLPDPVTLVQTPPVNELHEWNQASSAVINKEIKKPCIKVSCRWPGKKILLCCAQYAPGDRLSNVNSASLVGFICWCVRSLPSGLSPWWAEMSSASTQQKQQGSRMIGLAARPYTTVMSHCMGLRLKQQLSEGLAVASVYEWGAKDLHSTASNSHPTNEPKVLCLPQGSACSRGGRRSWTTKVASAYGQYCAYDAHAEVRCITAIDATVCDKMPPFSNQGHPFCLFFFFLFFFAIILSGKKPRLANTIHVFGIWF
jgi:hypothetical protein